MMMKWIKTRALIVGLIFISLMPASAQTMEAAEQQDPEYIQVLKGRADKIVATLDIAEPAKQTAVRDAIVMQYYNLSKIHDERDQRVEALKKQQNADDQSSDKQIASIEKETDEKLNELHKKYVSQLSENLSPKQVADVKDGMTYGVVPNTYNGYVAMLPDLTEEQKKKIMDYLVEAREHAMDAGSSEKKHWWFGQYKGKINNYLSAEGYDLNQAQKDWKKRRQAEADANN